jgi:hypothetical protein
MFTFGLPHLMKLTPTVPAKSLFYGALVFPPAPRPKEEPLAP